MPSRRSLRSETHGGGVRPAEHLALGQDRRVPRLRHAVAVAVVLRRHALEADARSERVGRAEAGLDPRQPVRLPAVEQRAIADLERDQLVQQVRRAVDVHPVRRERLVALALERRSGVQRQADRRRADAVADPDALDLGARRGHRSPRRSGRWCRPSPSSVIRNGSEVAEPAPPAWATSCVAARLVDREVAERGGAPDGGLRRGPVQHAEVGRTGDDRDRHRRPVRDRRAVAVPDQHRDGRSRGAGDRLAGPCRGRRRAERDRAVTGHRRRAGGAEQRQSGRGRAPGTAVGPARGGALEGPGRGWLPAPGRGP